MINLINVHRMCKMCVGGVVKKLNPNHLYHNLDLRIFLYYMYLIFPYFIFHSCFQKYFI